ncbi:MAG: hypothetical protein RL266_2092 [Bacteroidota bacterium]|jgi:hypothetical protein
MNPIKFIAAVSFSTIICSAAFAQEPKTFSTESKPTEVNAEAAKQEGSALGESCRFGSAYFSKVDLAELINIPGAVGVRFYISKEKKDQSYVDLLAVAVDKNGNELQGQSFQRQYLMVKALDKSYPTYAKGLNKFEAEQQTKNVKNGEASTLPFVAYMGISDLETLIKGSSCDGIRIFPAELDVEGSSYRTMSFGTVTYLKGDLQDASDVYLESALPCPIMCGGDGDKVYLWNK